MILTRELDDYLYRKEWLIVSDTDETGNVGEIMRFKWTPDLKHWLDTHEEQVKKGDISIFLEYRRLLKAGDNEKYF